MKKLAGCFIEKEGPKAGEVSASRVALIVPSVILTIMFVTVGFGLWFGWTSWTVWSGYFQESSKILYAGAAYVAKQFASGIKTFTNGRAHEDRASGPRH